MDILKISEWKTVDYPEKKVGTVEIKKIKYGKGMYLMEQVAGYDLFEALKPITITTLSVNGNMVMLDDPLHWLGMKKLAEHSKGKVFVGGLGLGLIIHHLVKNPKVKKIEVVELNKDVIKLIKPLLPEGKVKIFQGDILDQKWLERDYDTVILDVWVKSHKGKLREAGTEEPLDMTAVLLKFRVSYPNASCYIWGHRDREINPAVEKETSKDYHRFVKLIR